MELGIAGRTAVVTGAGRGIGEATARALEAEGATVVRVSRSAGIDVTALDAAERIAELAPAGVDILVNNAGTSLALKLDELREEDWQAQWDLHVMAPMRLMKAFAPGMAQRGWGRIVNVASSSAKFPSSLNPAYGVTKAGLLSLSRIFADLYAAEGVRVNAVAPGPTTTSLWTDAGGLADLGAAASGQTREQVVEAMEAMIPIGRYSTSEEVAGAIVYLCSELAGAVTGAAWSVDGGFAPVFL